MLKITLPRAALRGLSHLAARDDSRYYLNSVFVEARPDGRAILCATNDHMMGAYHCPDAVEGLPPERGAVQVIVPIEIIRAIKRAPKRGGESVEITGPAPAEFDPDNTDTVNPAPMMLRDPAHSIALEFTPIVARYHDYRRVIPARVAGTEVAHFNPAYVAALEDCAQSLHASKFVQSRIHHNGASGALVTIPADPAFIGVLMPMLVDDIGASAPDWVQDRYAVPVAPAIQLAAA